MRGLVLLSLLVACASAADRVGADPAQPGAVPAFDRAAVRVRQSLDPADAASPAAAKLLARVAQVEASQVDSTYQARTAVDVRRGSPSFGQRFVAATARTKEASLRRGPVLNIVGFHD